jgi:hypothetical protein
MLIRRKDEVKEINECEHKKSHASSHTSSALPSQNVCHILLLSLNQACSEKNRQFDRS